MPRRRLPCRGKVVKTVPMDPWGPAGKKFCGPAHAPVLNFFSAERRYADLGHPDRQGHDGLNFGELVRPLIDLPQIPVEREAVHGDDINMVENALCLHVLNEGWVDR